jgi:hypothetical protein
LKIAIHNHFAGQKVAETGLSRRIHEAARHLGWEAAEVSSSAEINGFCPDFVLALHFRTPKLTRYPTYGCMWNPPTFFAKDDRFIKNILSYNGYLSSSAPITAWLKDILYSRHKNYFVAPFYTSCHCVPYRPPQIERPRVLYAGTGWDGARFQPLFERLDREPYMEIYGPRKAWRYIRRAYRGLLPFDGSSILDALNKAGAGLCLHRQEHRDAGVPSLRVFEIVASGAIAICQEHPFIREAFGNSVFYLDSTDDMAGAIRQISEENPEKAVALSRKAYDIFQEKYTLEKLLSGIIPHHERLLSPKSFATNRAPKSPDGKSVQFIIRIGDRGTEYLSRALQSLVNQTCRCVGAIIVRHQEVSGLSTLLRSYADQLPIELVESPCTGFRSTQLWAGLKAVSSDYFGILDDDDIIHPNHVMSLLQLLDKHETFGVAYSGAIRVWEPRRKGKAAAWFCEVPAEPAELAYFEPFDLSRLVALNNFITSNSFIARSPLIKKLPDDPRLALAEDLFLLLSLCQRTDFIFSYEATCEFYWRGGRSDNAVWLDRAHWSADFDRIKTMFWGQRFPCAQVVGGSNIELENERLKEVIAHMERSKFWKMRQFWFRVKGAIGIDR